MPHSWAKLALAALVAATLSVRCGDGANVKGGEGGEGGDGGPALVADALAPDSAPLTDGTIETLDFPGVETGIFGMSEYLRFTLPDDAVSFTITVVGEESFLYSLGEVIDPNAVKLVEFSQDPSLCVSCKNRVAGTEEAAAFLFPITPTVSLAAGEYSFIVTSYFLQQGMMQAKPSKVDVRIDIYRYAASSTALRPTKGIVDLNFHFTGAGGITAANAAENEKLKKAVAEMRQIYQQVDLEIGTLRYRDISADHQAVDSISGKGNELAQMFKLGAGNEGGVNIFLVKTISAPQSGGGMAIVYGISGGIPGTTLLPGTAGAGVAVVAEVTLGFDGDFGAVMAHEVGHHLGLFHSSEAPWINIHDPLPDTSENDTKNLMFYAGDADIQDAEGANQLSGDQGFVMLNNPVVHLHP